ncbi:CotS family spore coat protein [Bacillus sp. AFS002410]|uniref:CotS family spore coat protein n=1 Tax=Bacillus sp. AFS002410 TaxID=2033481 RepID=UPI0015CF66F8|nr:CotS family spore coat protein [Bacillus sp. AFS002410]
MDAFFSDIVKKVISNYPLEVNQRSLECIDNLKAECPFDTNFGEVLLKKVEIEKEYIDFMIYAIELLRDNGVYTPEILTTKLGDGFVKMNDEHYMVFEAVNGRLPNIENEDDLIMMISGIATFHKASREIEITNEQLPLVQSDWQKELQNKYLTLTKWKEERTKAKNPTEIDKLFLKNINTILVQCEKSITLIDKYYHAKEAEATASMKSLSCQNIENNNFSIGEDGNLYFLNMSKIKIELPIHDIRRILYMAMKNEKTWSLSLMKKIIKSYQEINPLTCMLFKLLKAELMFPHLFYETFLAYYENKETNRVEASSVSMIKKNVALELSKERVIYTFFTQSKEVLND